MPKISNHDKQANASIIQGIRYFQRERADHARESRVFATVTVKDKHFG